MLVFLRTFTEFWKEKNNLKNQQRNKFERSYMYVVAKENEICEPFYVAYAAESVEFIWELESALALKKDTPKDREWEETIIIRKWLKLKNVNSYPFNCWSESLQWETLVSPPDLHASVHLLCPRLLCPCSPQPKAQLPRSTCTAQPPESCWPRAFTPFNFT